MADCPIPLGGYVDAFDADSNIYPSIAALVGQEFWIDDTAAGTGGVPGTRRTGGKRRYRVVINDSTVALLPKLAVRYSTTAGEYGLRVDGYAYRTADKVAGFVDDRVPSAGVPAGNAFLICVEGFHMCKSSAAGSSIDTAGARLVATTTTASTDASNAGRLTLQALASLTEAALANQVQNCVGCAVTGLTSGQTDTDMLVDLNIVH